MNSIKLHCLSFFVAMLLLSSCKNNDELYLKELQNQNRFLKEQYEQAKLALEAKTQSHPDAKPYNDVFVKQSEILENMIDSLKLFNEKELESRFKIFIKQPNIFFNNVQKEPITKLLPNDAKSVLISKDTLPLYSNELLLKESIKQRLLSHYFIVAQLLRDGSHSYYCGYTIIERYGYRLTITKDSIYTFSLNLKAENRAPYFKQLDFTSLSRIRKIDYVTEYIKFDKEVISYQTENGVVIFKTKALPKGFYRINCNKIVITEIGRLEKIATYFDFEIE